MQVGAFSFYRLFIVLYCSLLMYTDILVYIVHSLNARVYMRVLSRCTLNAYAHMRVWKFFLGDGLHVAASVLIYR